MKKYLLFIFFIFFIFNNAFPDNIYSLIKSGNLKEAADLLSSVSTASTRDGDKLFFLSLIEEDANRSAQLMEASLNASVSLTFRQEIYYRLAQYYFLKNEYRRLGQIVVEYRTKWNSGKYRNEMQRFLTLIDEKDKSYDAALRQTDRYLLEFTHGDEKQWGMVDKARVLRAFKKQIGAQKLLKKMLSVKSGTGVPQALYMLAMDAIDKKRTDDAVFYYNLMREGYPTAIGLNAIIEKMSSLSSSSDRDSRAEKITGTYYSIQVGVFSNKGNAKKQADLFKHYDKKVEIKNKKISNVKYHVVYVGRFDSYNSAEQFKKTLEAEHNEVFQVVAR